jgi:hypothetical protein
MGETWSGVGSAIRATSSGNPGSLGVMSRGHYRIARNRPCGRGGPDLPGRAEAGAYRGCSRARDMPAPGVRGPLYLSSRSGGSSFPERSMASMSCPQLMPRDRAIASA